MNGTSSSSALLPYGDRERNFMDMAIEQARLAIEANEVPVGCVIVKDNAVIAKAFNETNMTRNATRHCEFVAIDRVMASTSYNGEMAVLDGCELFVTCEPCIMCASALSQVGIGKVFYGCANDRFGGNGSIYSLHNVEGEHQYESIGGICEHEAIDLFREFYESGNPNAPNPKRARTIRIHPGHEPNPDEKQT